MHLRTSRRCPVRMGARECSLAARVLFALTAITTAAGAAFDPVACDKTYAFDVREWVVDYLRPTAPPRASPYSIASTNKKSAQLVNNTYPGPAIEATEGDLVCVTVNNNLLAEALVIHWHGQHMRGFPAMDGVYGVTQAGIPAQGGSFTYRWRANKGTHFYHAHMQAMQADRGLKGPIVVHAKNDPHAHLYQEEQVVALSDEWQNPGECLKAEGAQPGNPVCMEIEKASWNGVWGDGSAKYPWPMVVVDKGKCYRLRFIAMMGQAQNFQVSISGHNFTLIALDGADVVPIRCQSSTSMRAREPTSSCVPTRTRAIISCPRCTTLPRSWKLPRHRACRKSIPASSGPFSITQDTKTSPVKPNTKSSAATILRPALEGARNLLPRALGPPLTPTCNRTGRW